MSTSMEICNDFFKANLKNKGVWSSVTDAIKTKRAVICGKIVRKTPGENLCYELAEMYPKYNANRLFQIRFSQEISEHILSLSLKTGDCFTVCDVKVDLHQLICKNSEQPKPMDVILVDSWHKRNTVENVYYKRQNAMSWSSVSVACSLSDKSDPNKCTVDLFRIVDLDKAKEIAACVNKWVTTAANNDLPSTSRALRSSSNQSPLSSPVRLSRSGVQRNSRKTPEKIVNSDSGSLKHPPKILKGPSSKSESCFKSLVADFTGKNMPPKRDIVSSQTPHLTKLADVTIDDRMNVVAVLTDVPEKPLKCASNGYLLKLKVCDDSGVDDFIVKLRRLSSKDFPVLRPFNIMLFNGMKVNDEKCGSIGSKKNVVVFDVQDSRHIFAQSTAMKNADQILDRVEELRQWIFETIPTSRPFTSFCSFESKNNILNLRCRVLKAREYSSAATMILRVEDGTISPISVVLYGLNYISWNTCFTRVKITKSSGIVDILVEKVDEKFVDKVKSVNKNDLVELFGVSAQIKNTTSKTSLQHYLELSLVGEAKNLRVVRNEDEKNEPRHQDRVEIDQPLTSTSQPSRNSSSSNMPVSCTTRRRPLLDDIVHSSLNCSETDEDIPDGRTQRVNHQHEKTAVPSLESEPVIETAANNLSPKLPSDDCEKISDTLPPNCQPSVSSNQSFEETEEIVKIEASKNPSGDPFAEKISSTLHPISRPSTPAFNSFDETEMAVKIEASENPQDDEIDFEKILSVLQPNFESSISANHSPKETKQTKERVNSEKPLTFSDEEIDVENFLVTNVIENVRTSDTTETAAEASHTLVTHKIERSPSVLSDGQGTNRAEREEIVSTSENSSTGILTNGELTETTRVAESSENDVIISCTSEIDVPIENGVDEVPSDSATQLDDRVERLDRESPERASPIATPNPAENGCPLDVCNFDEDFNLTNTPLGDDIVDEWPDECEYGQPFRIRTRLKEIKPDIDKSSDTIDLFRLIYTYCVNCKYHPMNLSFVKWVTNGTARKPLCRTCRRKKEEVTLEFIFICDLILEDSRGNKQSVLAHGPYADKILGCNMENFHLESTREYVANRCRRLITEGTNLIVTVEKRCFDSTLLDDSYHYFLK